MKIKTLLCSGFAAVCTVMAVQVVIAYWQLNLIDKAVDNIVRASRNESMSREIAERVNGMRRYELGALVTADERDQQLERATKAGKENTQLAEELEKYQRNPETRQIAANMRTLNERYVRSHEQAVAFGKEGSLDAMRDLIQGEARKAQRELAAESEKFIKIQQERKLQAEQAAEAAHEFAEKLLIGLLLSGVAIAIGIALLVTRRITGQLGGEPEYARQLVQRIADGDLSQDLALQSGDTQSLMAHQQQMQLRLRTILKKALYAFRAVEHCRAGDSISDKILGRYALRMYRDDPPSEFAGR